MRETEWQLVGFPLIRPSMSNQCAAAIRGLRVLQVSTADLAGGAEKVAWDLFVEYRRRGLKSFLAVGRKRSGDRDVIEIPNEVCSSRWRRNWQQIEAWAMHHSVRVVPKVSRWIGDPARQARVAWGLEDFDFPGSRNLLCLPPKRPDVVHLHNLHGHYFDLRLLESLSRELPVLITMHDAWLLSGHCAHPLGCDRWQQGCGNCPDLTIYPEIRRDSTRANWRRKQRIYAASRLHVATPCKWLADKVGRSMLHPRSLRVIPHGIDLDVFRPGDKLAARKALQLPPDVPTVLFVGHRTRSNWAKDHATMEAAVVQLASDSQTPKVIFLSLGEERPSEQRGRVTILFLPFLRDPSRVALFYQAADAYVHATHADTFPNTVLEAMACGLPAIATAVGGIPEQVIEGETGFLTPHGEPAAMAHAIELLVRDNRLRHQLGQNAARRARQHFDLRRAASSYLDWYAELLAQNGAKAATEATRFPAVS